MLGAIELVHPGLTRIETVSPDEYVPSEAPLDLAAEMERACASTEHIRISPANRT